MNVIEAKGLSFELNSDSSLFKAFSFGFGRERTGLVGHNGVGKTCLMEIIAGKRNPTEGEVIVTGKIGYLPQNIELERNRTVAEHLGIPHHKAIAEDWEIEERSTHILKRMGLGSIALDRQLGSFSGGEVTQLLLAKVVLSDPEYVLLDEPTNNLDIEAREKVYQFIKERKGGMLVISHDRQVLSLMDQIVEMTSIGINVYGGNYTFYESRKREEQTAVESKYEKAKDDLKRLKRESQKEKERKDKKDRSGKRAALKRGDSKMIRKGARERSTNTDSRLRAVSEKKQEEAESHKRAAWEALEIVQSIDVDLPKTKVPSGKEVLRIEGMTFGYEPVKPLFKDFNTKIVGPERIALQGKNGSGKTSLLKLIMGELVPVEGKIRHGVKGIAYFDQHVQSLEGEKSIFENFQSFNPNLTENESRYFLAKFLFPNVTAMKKVNVLSGGERLRAGLACHLMAKEPPQLLILDEPTNHLDLEGIKAIEAMLHNYEGALLVVSHDKDFLKNISIERVVDL